MSRIGDALKRAGAPDITDGLLDLPLAATAATVTAGQLDQVAAVPEAPPDVGARTEGHANRGAGLCRRDSSERSTAPPCEPIHGWWPIPTCRPSLSSSTGGWQPLCTTSRRTAASSASSCPAPSPMKGKTLTSTNLALTLSESYRQARPADRRRPAAPAA